MKRLLILTAILTLMVGAANSQVLKPVKWQISFKKVSEGVYDIICKATIERDGICTIPNYRKTDLFLQPSTWMKTRRKTLN